MLTCRCKLFFFTATLAVSCLMPKRALAIGLSAYDGNQMLKECRAWVDLLNRGNPEDPNDPDNLRAMARGEYVNGAHCAGYVTGVIDDHFNGQLSEVSSTAALDPTKHFCLPDGVSANQAVRVVVKWLEDHPALLHERAIDLVLSALKDSFPCKKH